MTESTGSSTPSTTSSTPASGAAPSASESGASKTPETKARPNVPDVDDYVESRFDKLNKANKEKAEAKKAQKKDETAPAVKAEKREESPKDTSTKETEDKEAAKKEATDEKPDGKLYKVQWEGQEKEVSLKELIDSYQSRASSNEKFMQAAEVRRQAAALIQGLKQGPESAEQILKHVLGDKYRPVLEDLLMKEIEFEQMDPDTRKLHERARRADELEASEKERKEREDKQRQEQLFKEHHSNFSKQIIEALDSGDVPKTAWTVKQTAYYMQKALERGVKLTAKEVMPIVKRDYEATVREILSARTGDELLSLIGPDVIKQVRSADLRKVKTSGDAVSPENPTPTSREKVKPMTIQEWREQNEKRMSEMPD